MEKGKDPSCYPSSLQEENMKSRRRSLGCLIHYKAIENMTKRAVLSTKNMIRYRKKRSSIQMGSYKKKGACELQAIKVGEVKPLQGT